MTKFRNDLDRLNLYENIEKQVSTPKTLSTQNKSKKGIFEDFFNSIEDGKEDKILILSQYLNTGNFTLNDIKDIKITLNLLKNNQSKISNTLQYKISQIILQKLYDQNENDNEFCESFLTNFGPKENLEKFKMDISTLINKLESYDKYTNNLYITNGDIFDKIPNIYLLKNFDEQVPSNKITISELLKIEFQDIIDNSQSKNGTIYKNMGKLLMPNGNISNNFNITTPQIEKLIQTKIELESTDFPDDKQKLEIDKINKEIWDEYIAYFAQNEKTKRLADIFQKLVKNNFDFGQLDKLEKSILAQSNMVHDVEELHTSIDLSGYQKFLQELYDFSKSKHTIDLGGETLQLDIKKDFETGTHTNLQNIENLKGLPLSFVVNLDANSPEIIAEIEDPQNIVLSREMTTNGVISNYITKNGPMRIGNDYLLEIGGVQISTEILDKLLNCEPNDLEKNLKKYNLYQNFSQGNYDNDFSKFLADSDVEILKRNLKFEGEDTNKISQLYLLSQANSHQIFTQSNTVGEKMIHGAQRENDEGNTKANENAKNLHDTLLDSIEILENPSENDDEPPYRYDENIVLTKAAELYNELNDEEKRDFATKFRELCVDDEEHFGNYGGNVADEILYQIEDPDPAENTPNTPYTPERADTPAKAFEKEWNKINGRSDCKFEEGTRLYIKTSDSELPPDDSPDSFFVFEICNIKGEPGNGTFGVKAIGSEIKLEDPGKVYDDLPYTAEKIADIAKSGTLYKMPERKDKGWLDCIQRVTESKAAGKLTAFGDMEGQVKLKGDTFVDQDGNEVKYFDRIEDDVDIENGKAVQGTKISKYEIKSVNTLKGTVNIASTFDGVDRSNPNGITNVKYKYENELTFEQFILLIESKKLKGYNEEQQEHMENKYEVEKKDRLPGRGLFRMVSIGNFISIFKNNGKKIKDLWKENQKEQEDHLENFLFSTEGLDLYTHIGKMMSLGGLLGDVKNAFDEAELDYYNNRDDRLWKKIDKRYKKFSSDPMYPALYGSHLKDVLLRDDKKENLYRGKDKDRYKFAAAVLIMLKKEGPYPRDFKNKIGEGYRVESFLGKEHRKIFKDFYEQKKQRTNEVKDMGYSSGVRMDNSTELNKLEFQYIIGVIDGSGPHANNDDAARKSVRSNKFKDELQANLDSYYDKHEEEKNKFATFKAAEETYLKKQRDGIFNKVIPALQAMCEKANTPGEIFRLKGYLLSSMLMGSTANGGSTKSWKPLWQTARSMGFSPLCRIRDPNHPEKIQRLLQGISEGDSNIENFLSTTNFNFKDFSGPGIAGNYTTTHAKLLDYRNKNGKQILKYIENPTYYNKETSTPENSINARAKAKKYPNREIFGDIVKFHNDDDQGNINSSVNSINFIKVAPLTAKGNIMKHYMPSGGVYKTDKEEDISDAKDVWSAIATAVAEQASPEDVESYLKYFLNLFINQIDTSELSRTISLIEELKKRGCNDEAEYIRWYIFRGNMHKHRQGGFPDEFKKCFEVFSKLFYDSIGNTLNENVIKNAFGVEHLSDYHKPFKMINRKQWNTQMGGDDMYNRGGGKFEKNAKAAGYQQYDTINYQIKQLKKDLRKYGVSFKKIPSSFENSDINLDFLYDEENNLYTPRENTTPISTT